VRFLLQGTCTPFTTRPCWAHTTKFRRRFTARLTWAVGHSQKGNENMPKSTLPRFTTMFALLLVTLAMMVSGCRTYHVGPAPSNNLDKASSSLNWMLRHDGVFRDGPWGLIGTDSNGFTHVHTSNQGPSTQTSASPSFSSTFVSHSVGYKTYRGGLVHIAPGSIIGHILGIPVTHRWEDITNVAVRAYYVSLGTCLIMDPTTLSYVQIDYANGESESLGNIRTPLFWTFFPFYLLHTAEGDARRAASAIEYYRAASRVRNTSAR
jgi:hypothetical protein